MDENVSEQASGAEGAVHEQPSEGALAPQEAGVSEAAPPIQVAEPERDILAELPAEKLVSHPRFQEELRRREQSAKDRALYELRRQQEQEAEAMRLRGLDPEDFKDAVLRQQESQRQEAVIRSHVMQEQERNAALNVIQWGLETAKDLPQEQQAKVLRLDQYQSWQGFAAAVVDALADQKAQKLADKKLKERSEAATREARADVRSETPPLIKGAGSPAGSYEDIAAAYARGDATREQYAAARKQAGFT